MFGDGFEMATITRTGPDWLTRGSPHVAAPCLRGGPLSFLMARDTPFFDSIESGQRSLSVARLWLSQFWYSQLRLTDRR
jgi:hypothetical protein